MTSSCGNHCFLSNSNPTNKPTPPGTAVTRGIYGRVSQGMLGRADKGTVQEDSIQLLRFRNKFGMTLFF